MPSDEASPPVNLDRRKLILGSLLATGAGVSYARRPRHRIDYLGSRKLDELIPAQAGSWQFATTSGLVVPPDDALSAALYSQLLTRVYTDGSNPPIMLLIAQSANQTGILQVHRPEFCYPASGYVLSPIVQRYIQQNNRTVIVNELTASVPGRTERVLYWTRVGDAMPISWWQQRLAIAADNLKGRIPDAVLVRVSTIDADGHGAFGRLAAFIETMIAALPPAGQRVLVSNA